MQFPGARVGDGYFRGSGTSQATAVASGLAALVLQQRPNLAPDQVKAVSARRRPTSAGTDRRRAATGAVDVGRLAGLATPVGRLGPAGASAPRSSSLLERSQSNGGRTATRSGYAALGTAHLVGPPWTGRRWSGVKWPA